MAPARYHSSNPSSTPSSKRSAPLGIKIICVLGALGGILGLFFSLILLGTSVVLGLITLVITVGQLVVIYGLWHLQSWAYPWALLIYVSSAFISLIGGDVIGLVVGIFIIVYLVSKSHLFSR